MPDLLIQPRAKIWQEPADAARHDRPVRAVCDVEQLEAPSDGVAIVGEHRFQPRVPGLQQIVGNSEVWRARNPLGAGFQAST